MRDEAVTPVLSVDDLPWFFEAHHLAVAEKAREFARTLTAEDGDERERTRTVVARMGADGLTAWCVPERFGGARVGRPEDVDVRAIALIREALGYADGLADTALAMQGLGSYPITLAGTEAQKARYLPGILDGTRLGAFALTEPEAGSDVANLACRARRDGDHYVLDGAKTFISNAGVAGQYVVFATLDPEAGREGITAFVVEPGDPGLHVEPLEVIAPHPIGTLRFDGCRVPAERRLGDEGGGFKLAMGTLDVFRTTVGAAALGMARRALDEALAYATRRVQFGRPIARHQIIGAYLAEMATDLDAARLLVFRAAFLRDVRGASVTREVAMGKLYATEAASRIIDLAVQVHGGQGVLKGSVVERLYREIRALRIYEGTSEIQKLIISSSLLRN
jgi:acyl-CoA dehydrogenase